MGDFIKPTITGEPYRAKDVIAIRDRYQQYSYIKLNVYPVDIYVSGSDLVMVFLKSQTRDLYELWRKHEL